MLPGFRILAALVVLSVAMLIFGFGAVALLRTAHQNLASQPTWQPAWQTPVEVARAQRNERQQQPDETQTLALLRVDPPAPQAMPSADSSASVTTVPSSDVPPSLDKRNEVSLAEDAAELIGGQPAETTPVEPSATNDRPTSRFRSPPLMRRATGPPSSPRQPIRRPIPHQRRRPRTRPIRRA